jgi:hypothetical protein
VPAEEPRRRVGRSTRRRPSTTSRPLRVFSPLRSRTNFDPAIHNGPEWKDIPADELLPIGVPVADCVGDLDGDNDTDGADIARLLGNWGSSDLNSDINGDGIVDGADLAALLGSWGPCE